MVDVFKGMIRADWMLKRKEAKEALPLIQWMVERSPESNEVYGLLGNCYFQLEQFERAVLARPEVMECYLMTGDADYHLRVVVEDLSAYERFLMDQLTRVQGIANIRSSFALKQVKYTTALPLESSALRG